MAKVMKRVSIEQLLKQPKLLAEFNLSMQNGAVSVIPTDTVYGFAVDASQPLAVEKIYRIKNRSERKPLILLFSQLENLDSLQLSIPIQFKEKLIDIWPGPLTIVIENKKTNSKCLTAFNFTSIGVRMPAHEKLLKIMQQYPNYFLTTSTNRSNQKPLLSPDDIENEFKYEIDWLIEDGNYDKKLTPSTIIDLTTLVPKILRAGKINFNFLSD